MKVDLEHLEYLSKLKLPESEKEKFEVDFIKILDFVDEITKLNLPKEDEAKAVPLCDLREDEVKETEPVDTLMNAPKKLDGCFVTPLVVE